MAFWTRVAAICKDVAQPGETISDGAQHIRRAIAVLNIASVDHSEQQQTKGIGDYVALAALDFFTGIIPASPSTLGRFNALAVDHTS